jgi:predicted small lipoprotein YifL
VKGETEDFMSRSLKLVAILACATFAVTACGKRGVLQPPAAVDKSAAAQPNAKEKPHKDFVLDKLLQ